MTNRRQTLTFHQVDAFTDRVHIGGRAVTFASGTVALSERVAP